MLKRSVLFVFSILVVVTCVSAQSDTSEAEAHFNIGTTHLREGRTKLAIEEFERAVKIAPDNSYFLKGLGTAYLVNNQYRRAIELFRKALKANPYYVIVRHDLGTALIYAGQREEGKKEFLTAYHDPTNPTPELAAFNLGQAYSEEKRYDEALSWYRTSVSRNVRYPDAQLALAAMLLTMGRLEPAILHLEQAVNDTSDDVRVIFMLGDFYTRAGRFTDARRRFEQVVTLAPASSVANAATERLKKIPQKNP